MWICQRQVDYSSIFDIPVNLKSFIPLFLTLLLIISVPEFYIEIKFSTLQILIRIYLILQFCCCHVDVCIIVLCLCLMMMLVIWLVFCFFFSLFILSFFFYDLTIGLAKWRPLIKVCHRERYDLSSKWHLSIFAIWRQIRIPEIDMIDTRDAPFLLDFS